MAFDLFQDKENRSQLGVMARLHNVAATTGLVGKTFQSASQRPIMPVARRALGDVNRRNGTGNITGPTKGGLGLKPGSTCLKPPAPANKPPSTKHLLNKKTKMVLEGKVEISVKTKECPVAKATVPDKEIMDLPDETEDDFEDIWPKAERPEAFIPQLQDWRPARLFPCDDLDMEDDLIQDNSADEINIIKDLTLEEPDIEIPWESDEGISLEDVRLPQLTDLMASADTDLFNQLL